MACNVIKAFANWIALYINNIFVSQHHNTGKGKYDDTENTCDDTDKTSDDAQIRLAIQVTLWATVMLLGVLSIHLLFLILFLLL